MQLIHRSNSKGELMRTLSKQKGLSLVELMIALVIGLIIMGGVYTVTISSIKAVQAKNELDDAQDSFRFLSSTLGRIIRNAETVDAASTDTSLKIVMSRGSERPDCLGNEGAATVNNTFSIVDGKLMCDNGGGNTELVRNLSSISFSYGTPSANKWVESYKAAADVSDWADITSVKVTVATETGLSTQFTTAIREKVVEQAGSGS